MATSQKLDLLIKLLNLTSSSTDGEALSASRKANALVDGMGTTWEDLLRGKVTIMADPFTGLSTPPPPRQAEMPTPPRPRPQPQPFTAGAYTSSYTPNPAPYRSPVRPKAQPKAQPSWQNASTVGLKAKPSRSSPNLKTVDPNVNVDDLA